MGEDFISAESIDELLERTVIVVKRERESGTILGVGPASDPLGVTEPPLPDVIRVPIISRKRDTKPLGKEGETLEARGNTYIKKKLLGAGGMGAVFHGKRKCEADVETTADDVRMDVAIKEVNGLDPGSSYTHALRQEAQRMSTLDSEYIVKLLDLQYEPETKTYYLIMEYVNGMDVDGLIKLHRMHRIHEIVRDSDLFSSNDGIPDDIHAERILRIPDKISAFVVWSVANALEYAHDPRFGSEHKRLIHRDISPGNILIKLDGSVKLADFGIAVNMEDIEGIGGIWSGKLSYTSPEAISDTRSMDTRSDLYSLGVVLYEMMTGFKPNDEFDISGSLQERVTRLLMTYELPLVPPHKIVRGVDRRLSDIACKLLENDPAKRYQDATDLIDDIGFGYMFRGPGPTKQGLRDYLEVRKYRPLTEKEAMIASVDPDTLSEDAKKYARAAPQKLLKYLRFMRPGILGRIRDRIDFGVWSRYRIHNPLEFTPYTIERLRKKENPARLPRAA